MPIPVPIVRREFRQEESGRWGLVLYFDGHPDADQTDFAPVGKVCDFSFALAVPSNSPVKNLKEFVAYAKSRPGQLNYAGGSVGSAAHLAGELFNALGGVDITHIPYKSGGQSIQAVIAQEVEFTFENPAVAMPLIQSGTVRALAVTSKERTRLAPEIPTVAESGLPGFELNSWFGLLAPAGTPAAVVQKLNQVVNANLSTPEMVARLKTEGATATPTSPEAFGQLIQREIKRWRPVVLNAKITAD